MSKAKKAAKAVAASVRNRAMRIARELREKYREKGEFTTAQYEEALEGALRPLASESFGGFVKQIATAIDDEGNRDKSGTDLQKVLFDVEGEYKLGDTRRIAKRLAQIDHAETSLQIKHQNALAVMQAYEHEKDELDRLRPYWKHGVTKQDAIKAWKKVNGET